MAKKIFSKYSKYGLLHGLILLIPFFSLFTLLPMVVIATFLGNHLSDCEEGYKITYLCSLFIAIIIDFIFIINRTSNENPGKENVLAIFFVNLLLFTLVNSFVFVAILGTHFSCHGDGQTILVAFVSGPISSFFIVLNGIVIDLALFIKGIYVKQ